MPTVCLITPPSPFVLDERVFISIGILRVAASLEQAGHSVELLDLNGVTNFEPVLREHAESSPAVVFGITATTPQMPTAARIAAVLRQTRPEARVVLGGPHVTLVHAARRREVKVGVPGRASRAFDKLASLFDTLVVGDGEDAIFEAIHPGAQKVVDADDPSGLLFLTNKRYGEMPFPARHLVDVSSYHYSIEGVPAISLIAQLGCPFACAFCGGRSSPMLRKIRTRTTESVIAEIRHLHDEHGMKGFMFFDDELNVNKSVVGLMRAIGDLGKELGVEWKLRGFVKSELFNEEQAEAMWHAGFRWLLCGFESGSPRILENINKKATREQNTRCISIAHKYGFKVKCLMSLGHAGDSEQTIRETKEWLLENKADDFDATVITVYPGCPYYDEAVETSPGVWTFTAKSGDRLHSYEVDFSENHAYYKGRPGDYRSFTFTDHLSPEQLVALRDDLENDVRTKLGIKFNASSPGVQYEASMGSLPGFILRRSPRVMVPVENRRLQLL